MVNLSRDISTIKRLTQQEEGFAQKKIEKENNLKGTLSKHKLA